MNHGSKHSAVNASNRKQILAGELSFRNMGQAFLYIYEPYFIVGFTVKSETITVTALSVENGSPTLREFDLKRSTSMTLLPDLYLALFAPQHVDGDKDAPIESVNVSLPSNPWILPKEKTRRKNEWALETANASNITLKAN